MNVRSTLRGVVYRVLRHPDSEVTLTARCMSGDGCRWELDGTADLKAGGVAMIEHTAATGHTIFTRRREDVACVVPANAQEPTSRVAPSRRGSSTTVETATAATAATTATVEGATRRQATVTTGATTTTATGLA